MSQGLERQAILLTLSGVSTDAVDVAHGYVAEGVLVTIHAMDAEVFSSKSWTILPAQIPASHQILSYAVTPLPPLMARSKSAMDMIPQSRRLKRADKLDDRPEDSFGGGLR